MAKSVAEIDGNLAVASSLNKENIVYLDPRAEPFEIYGLCNPKTEDYKRMPRAIAETVSEGVAYLYRHTSGGRICFATDSPYVALKVTLPANGMMSHMAFTGISGFDVYVNEGEGFKFNSTVIPPSDVKNEYENITRNFGERKMREIMLHFPLYNGVDSVYIGLDGDSKIEKASPYQDMAPMVFYGSSITQGGCVSRPGNNYPAIVSRHMKMDFICLGFSGCARAEDTMRDYIASLDMSVFVMDYDHNAPDAEYLEKTHQPFFKSIRKAKPDLPIIIMSAPDTDKDLDNMMLRRDICYKTYLDARNQGDRNVFFIDGSKIFDGPHRDACTVDGCHPNDLGFSRMADAVIKVLDVVFPEMH